MATGADFQRMVGDLGRLGTVASVDHASATCRVQIGAILSGDLPWLEYGAGTTRTWCPPSVGEQVFVFSPEADLACGFVAGSLFSDQHPAPWADKDEIGIRFGDDGYVAYNASTHELVAVVPTGGKALIEATGGITLRGDVKVEGKLETTADAKVGGKLEAERDVLAGGVSLQKHVHDKVQAGGAISGKPVA